MKKVFNGKIDRYHKIPIVDSLEIDEDKDYFYMHVEFSKKPEVLFQIYLIDSNNILRLQHLVGYSKRNISIGKNINECSIGAYPGEICTGTWKLVIVTDNENLKEKTIDYSIEIETTDIKKDDEINFLGEDLWVDLKKENDLLSLNNYDWNRELSKESRWYKGDFHTHSQLSDGKMNNDLYMEIAESMGLDFVVPTEHNILSTGWKCNNKILVIPGIEITFPDGHFNILGASKFPIDMINISKGIDSYDQIVEEILLKKRNKEAIYSINHPVLEFWKWKFNSVELQKVNTIEICNDPTYYLGEESNNKTIKLMDVLWNDGYRIYGIGGSDSHILPTETYYNSEEPSIIGDPGTFVYCNQLTANDILDGVRMGHVYVSRGITLDIDIKVTEGMSDEKSYLPGDEIILDDDDGKITYVVNFKSENIKNSYGDINKIDETLKMLFIENGKIVGELIDNSGEVSFSTTWRKNEFKWLRAEIRTLDNKFIAYVNPVYHGEKVHELKNCGDLFSLVDSKK